MSATRRAVIGSRGFAFRSWRAYGKQRDHGGDPLRRPELRRLDHLQQLHQVAVDRARSRSGRGRRRSRGSTRRSGRRSRRSRTSSSSISPSSTPSCSAIALGELRVRAAGEHHQALLRPALDPVPGLRLAVTHALASRGREARAQSFRCRACIPLLVLLACTRDRERIRRAHPSVITDPAAIHAPSPTSTGATKPLWIPVLTFCPIVVRPFGRPGW